MKFCPILPQFLFDIISDFNKLCGDGSAKRIYKCNHKRCQLKTFFLLKKTL